MIKKILKITGAVLILCIAVLGIAYFTLHLMISRIYTDEVPVTQRDSDALTEPPPAETYKILSDDEFADETMPGETTAPETSPETTAVQTTSPETDAPETTAEAVTEAVTAKNELEEQILADPNLTLTQNTPTDLHIDYYVEVPFRQITPIYEVQKKDLDVTNILFIGLDSADIRNNGVRSDSMLMVSYNGKEGTVKLVSFMRDVWVELEGHQPNRLNVAYAFGGAGMLVNTINSLFDLDIQYYVVLATNEFKQFVDDIGGLDMALNENEVAYFTQYNGFNAEESLNDDGTYHLNGTIAMRYARLRRYANGDFTRVQNQHFLIFAIYHKMMAGKSLGLVGKYVDFALANAHTNINTNDLLSIVTSATAYYLNISTYRIPQPDTWEYAMNEGRSVIYIDLEKNKQLLHGYVYGE